MRRFIPAILVAILVAVPATALVTSPTTQIHGVSAPGAAVDGNPILAGGSDGTNARFLRVGSAGNLSATTQEWGLVSVGPGEWSTSSVAAANAQATVTKAAGGAGVRHVCTSITVVLSNGGSPPAPSGSLTVNLIDGATGGTTYLWRAYINATATAGDNAMIPLTGLNLPGTANTGMTLEFSAAGGVSTFESVTLAGYSVQ